MQALIPYLPTDRRHAMAMGEMLPDPCQGAALFVDISGFTRLAEALGKQFGSQRGAEELTQHLNQVYDALIADLDRHRGSVIGFSGDAMTCWFDADDGLAATFCAVEMQRTMQQFGAIRLDSGAEFPLSAKGGVAVGGARRFVVGDPERQLIDVLAGRLLDEIAEAEHQAGGGEVALGPSALEALSERVRIGERRQVDGRQLGLVQGVEGEPERQPWPDLPGDSLSEEQIRPWLLGPVFQRLRSGQGEFLAELRPAVALFLRFEGIDYDADIAAGEKLDEFVRRVQRVLAGYEGTLVDITTGDKGSYLYMAFGAPIAHEDDVERAASAALDLRAAAAATDFLTTIQIGINRGRMRAGAYGGRTRRTYGVLGDATNLAARLMTAADPGEILVTQTTADQIEHAFAWEPHSDISVKGKRQPIAVAGLHSRSEASVRDRPARRHLLPMVGREGEFSTVQELTERAADGRGQIIEITGEAGMGKSRLVAEAIRSADAVGFSILQGEGKSYGNHSPYLIWTGIWRGLFNLKESQSVNAQEQSLRASLQGLQPDLLPRLPLLGPLLNLAIPDSELTRHFDAKSRKAALEAMLVGLLRSLARRGPLMLVLEDTHWIDPLSAELMQVLGPAVEHLPAVIVLAGRQAVSEGDDQLVPDNWPHLTRMGLTALAPEHTEQWIYLKSDQLFGADQRPPEAFAERLVDRSEGNPFYVEEVLNYLKDHGIAVQDSQALSGLDLPASLHSLVLSRIDELEERPRSALRVASVCGRSFTGPLLVGAYPELQGDGDVSVELAELDRKGFIEADSANGGSYLFRQGVIREVAYESLPFKLRRTLHVNIADFIERTEAEALEPHTDLLAHHFFMGESWPKALDYKLSSARKAQRSYANSAAVLAAQQALRAADQLEWKPSVQQSALSAHEVLGDVLGWQALYVDSIAAYGEMLKLAEVTEDAEAQARAWHGMAQAQVHQGDLRAGIESAKHEEEVAVAAALDLALAKARLIQGWGAFRLGEIDQALKLTEDLAELSRDLEDRGQQAECLNLIGVLHWASGQYEESEAAFEQARAIFEDIGDQRRAMPLSNNLGVIAESRGDFETAEQRYNQALQIARRIGNRDGEMVYLGNLGGVKVLRGDHAGAEADLREVLEIADPEGMDVLADILRLLGEACLGQDKLEEAVDFSTNALKIALDTESQDDIGAAWRVLGMVVAEVEQPPVLEHPRLGPDAAADAESCFAESERIFRDLGREDELARTLRTWAEYERSRGNHEQADTKWKEAVGLFERIGAEHEVSRMTEAQARAG